MKNNYIKVTYMLIMVLMVTSACVSKKDMIYFQNEEAVKNALLNEYAPKIQTDDLLSIFVSAEDVESSNPFNLYEGGQGAAQRPINYLVTPNGMITFPVLGEIKVAGFTTNELKALLISKLTLYIKKPIVTIRLENFRISVLGEVKSPGAFSILNEQVSIPEALALAGDLTIQGKRKNILLLRKNGDQMESIRLDLTDKSIFKSPYYYLAQNDILYVEPNRAKVNSSAIGTTSSLISIATAVLSLVLILTR
ncbi:polysaccharide biosynthesis/export family protein [uncultured Lutibacter sp.]|uniref:polysaccharide biosynthesis/export family protein n=1 Tax=uncultured Lutibacter sp. TaxID=437739 RepID=UPI00262F2007|nr:polysaccharide biosynthesis/export family protein [uncultured Lutibacter sp.]